MVYPVLYCGGDYYNCSRYYAGKCIYHILHSYFCKGHEMAGKIFHCHGDVCHWFEHEPDQSDQKRWQADCYGLLLLDNFLFFWHS